MEEGPACRMWGDVSEGHYPRGVPARGSGPFCHLLNSSTSEDLDPLQMQLARVDVEMPLKCP